MKPVPRFSPFQMLGELHYGVQERIMQCHPYRLVLNPQSMSTQTIVAPITVHLQLHLRLGYEPVEARTTFLIGP